MNIHEREHADSCHFSMDDSAVCDCFLFEYQEALKQLKKMEREKEDAKARIQVLDKERTRLLYHWGAEQHLALRYMRERDETLSLVELFKAFIRKKAEECSDCDGKGEWDDGDAHINCIWCEDFRKALTWKGGDNVGP